MATKVSTSENKILFAVLNWGIGHATRSAGVIDALLERGEKVSVYCNGRALKYLQKRYGKSCDFIEGYNYTKKYTSNSLLNYLTIAFGLFRSFIVDTKRVSALLNSGNFKLFINDCRPLHVSPTVVESVLINHQLSPFWPCAKRIIQKRFVAWQSKYTVIWVPDYCDNLLSGALSIEKNLKNTVYIGPLSRWITPSEIETTATKSIVFFGIAKHELKEATVEGLTDIGYTLRFFHSEDGDESELVQALKQAKLVVTKPGYSSVMELFELKTNTVVVDVLWHAEQHQIFKHLQSNKVMHTLDELSIQELDVLSTEIVGHGKSRGNEKLLSLALDNLLNEC